MTIPFQIEIESGQCWIDNKWSGTEWPDGESIMEPAAILRFRLAYPLAKPKLVEMTHDDGTGWTKHQFIAAVRDTYMDIYEEEVLMAAQDKPKPYGIWGHDLGDLILEGALKQGDVWEVIVGS